MALNWPANYFQASFHHQATGSLKEAVCTFAFAYTGPNIYTAGGAISNAWNTAVMSSVGDVWKYIRFVLRTNEGAIQEIVKTDFGRTAHTPMPANIAFLIRKNSGQPGRRGRGRMFLPGVSEQDADQNGVVVGSKITELNANLATFYTAVTDADCDPCILHNTNIVPPPSNTAPTPFASFTVEPIIGLQTRRLK